MRRNQNEGMDIAAKRWPTCELGSEEQWDKP